MREARRPLAVVGTLVVAACGGTAVSPGTIKLTPTVGTTSVMECLSQETKKLGYQIIRLDREDGNMVAERRDKDPKLGDPREYAGGDLITVSRLKREGDVVPLELKSSSFIMEWLYNGANQKAVSTSDRVRADVKSLSETCRL